MATHPDPEILPRLRSRAPRLAGVYSDIHGVVRLSRSFEQGTVLVAHGMRELIVGLPAVLDESDPLPPRIREVDWNEVSNLANKWLDECSKSDYKPSDMLVRRTARTMERVKKRTGDTFRVRSKRMFEAAGFCSSSDLLDDEVRLWMKTLGACLSRAHLSRTGQELKQPGWDEVTEHLDMLESQMRNLLNGFQTLSEETDDALEQT